MKIKKLVLLLMGSWQQLEESLNLFLENIKICIHN